MHGIPHSMSHGLPSGRNSCLILSSRLATSCEQPLTTGPHPRSNLHWISNRPKHCYKPKPTHSFRPVSAIERGRSQVHSDHIPATHTMEVLGRNSAPKFFGKALATRGKKYKLFRQNSETPGLGYHLLNLPCKVLDIPNEHSGHWTDRGDCCCAAPSSQNNQTSRAFLYPRHA